MFAIGRVCVSFMYKYVGEKFSHDAPVPGKDKVILFLKMALFILL